VRAPASASPAAGGFGGSTHGIDRLAARRLVMGAFGVGGHAACRLVMGAFGVGRHTAGGFGMFAFAVATLTLLTLAVGAIAGVALALHTLALVAFAIRAFAIGTFALGIGLDDSARGIHNRCGRLLGQQASSQPCGHSDGQTEHDKFLAH